MLLNGLSLLAGAANFVKQKTKSVSGHPEECGSEGEPETAAPMWSVPPPPPSLPGHSKAGPVALSSAALTIDTTMKAKHTALISPRPRRRMISVGPRPSWAGSAPSGARQLSSSRQSSPSGFLSPAATAATSPTAVLRVDVEMERLEEKKKQCDVVASSKQRALKTPSPVGQTPGFVTPSPVLRGDVAHLTPGQKPAIEGAALWAMAGVKLGGGGRVPPLVANR